MMTLANMRLNGTRYVSLWCTTECGLHVDICADGMDESLEVRSLGKGYRCTKCGRPDPESRPAWHKREGKPFGTL